MLRKLLSRLAGALRPRTPRPARLGACTVIEVPYALGWRALRRLRTLGLRLGPVAVDHAGRVLYCVRATPAHQILALVSGLGWRDERAPPSGASA